MIVNNMSSFLKIIRPINLIIVAFTMILVFYFLINPITTLFISNINLAILIFSVVCITASGNIINDIYDVDCDKVNKPEKVFITSYNISSYRLYYYILNTIGIFGGIYLSVISGYVYLSFIFIIASILLWLYSYSFKRIAVLGNLVVALLSSVSIILPLIMNFAFYGNLALVLSKDGYAVIVLSVFGFLVSFSREIIKDIEDISGDSKAGFKTLPIVLGISNAKFTSLIFQIVTIVLLILVGYYLYIFEKYLLLLYIVAFMITPQIVLIKKVIGAKEKEEYKSTSNFFKITMLLGILSVLALYFS